MLEYTGNFGPGYFTVKVLYITSDRPGAGKTALAASVATFLGRLNKNVGYLKPFSENAAEDADTAFMYGQVLGSPDSEMVPVYPLETKFDEVKERLTEAIKSLSGQKDVVLVEGPSLMASESDVGLSSLELAELFDAMVLVVVHNTPALDTGRIQELASSFGQNLVGVIVNSVTRHKVRQLENELIPQVEADGIRVLGGVPEDRLLLTPTVGQLTQHLNAQWMRGEERAEELVEHFLIGGNVMDSGVDYFERVASKAVIVRGDRPDIQLAALATPTVCLVLTGGHQPIEYVSYEAEQQDVPVIVVQGETMSTTEALGALLDWATVHHPKKVERFLELLQHHTDMDALSSALLN